MLHAHMKETEVKLGHEFENVHRWLDEFATRALRMLGHRSFRHHREGIEEVRKKWGDLAARAAELHVLADTGHIPSLKDYETGKVDMNGFLPDHEGHKE